MSRWRVIVVAVLIVAPFAGLAVLGSWFLWREGLIIKVWWPMTVCMIVGYVLAWYWQRQKQLLRPLDFTPSLHWTERDREAWRLVEDRAKSAANLGPEKLTEYQFYADTAREMSLELARFYHPNARDPLESLTIPEILAVVELAAHDLAEMVDQYLPAGHLLSIKNWRQAKQASDWYQTFNNVYWLVSAAISPVNTGVRYATSRMGISRPLQLIQENLVAWFYTAFVHRLGTYLIDLNSGRLRVGAHRYRQLLRGEGPEKGVWTSEQKVQTPFSGPISSDKIAAHDPADDVREVIVTVMGQVKAGKSSFINAVLGEQRALTDVLPATNEITRYELQPQGISTKLVLLDTVGYAHSGPREDQVKATQEAARQSDLLVLVVHARNPARLADQAMLEKLRALFQSRPELKAPPVLAVMTHIDLLSPAMEWSPPYDWQQPTRHKEKQIQEAWITVRDQVGEFLAGIVPACTAAGKVYGIEEWFLPALTELLDEARAVALLRCLRTESDAGKIRKVARQLWAAARDGVNVLLSPSSAAPPDR